MATPTLPALASAAHAAHYNFTTEAELQAGLAERLTQAGYEVSREVVLSKGERIDLLVGDVGIEVKINGSLEALMRQLQRYAKFDEVQSMLVVTTKPKHTNLPLEVDGKKVDVVVVGSPW